MKYRFKLTNISGTCLFFVIAALGLAATMVGCKQKSAKSNSDNQESTSPTVDSPSVPTTLSGDDGNNPGEPIETAEPQSNTSQPDIDDMLRIAAGPMADSVNSSLARLNTNLGRKEHTLVLMAMKSETRRWYFLTHMVSIIDKEQLQQATDLIDSYGDTWQDLLDRRARILEYERDVGRVQQLLDYNKVAALKLTMLVRQRILREIFTPEQRKQYAAKFEKAPEGAGD